MLKPTKYGTRVEGSTVVLTIGNSSMTMDYNTAISIASFLFHAGKQAKRVAGDQSKRLIGLGTLTDANMDEMKAQSSRDGTAIYKRH